MHFDDCQELCEKRRSIRYFDDKKTITMEEVLELLKLAQLAPSVENIQPWHFHVIFDTAVRSRIMQASCYGNFILGAAVFIVVTCDKSAKPTSNTVVWNPRELEFSCVAAMEHIMLGAAAKGFASSWVSLHHGAAHDIMKLKEHEVVIGGIMLGYPKPGEELPGAHHERKSLNEIYTIH